jgi:hypothetical protein
MKRIILILLLCWPVLSAIVTAQPNNALHFDGQNDYVDLDTLPASCYFSEGFTFTAWVKWDEFMQNSRLLEINSNDSRHAVMIGNYEKTDSLVVTILSGGAENRLMLPDAIVKHTWMHIAVTINYWGFTTIYINGAERISAVVNSMNWVIDRPGSYLGKSTGSAVSWFNGTMDEVSIWKRDITYNEVVNVLKNNLTGGESGLLIYYNFNQGTAGGDNTGIDTLESGVSAPDFPGTLKNFALSGTTSNWLDGYESTGIDTLLVAIPSKLTIGHASGSTGSLVIVSGKPWTAGKSCDWLKLDPESGTGVDIITVTATTANEEAVVRSSSIVISTDDGNSVTVPVIQSISFTPPASGDGTESNPYEIATLGNLYWMSQSPVCWTSYFIQIADIDAADTKNWYNGNGFKPIGNDDGPFKGHYNGKGHVISNLTINRPVIRYVGLFGRTNEASVDSLGITDADITGSQLVGTLIGITINSTLNQCYATGRVSGIKQIGGITGACNMSTVNNCYSKSSVSGITEIGGLIGTMYKDTILHCYTKGRVSGACDYVGGIVGYCESINMSCCYSTGQVSGQYQIGGISGYGMSCNTRYCYSTGHVSGNNFIGGLLGFSSGCQTDFCYSTASVSGDNNHGGLIGGDFYSSRTSQCYTAGSVSGRVCYGGITGYIYKSTLDSCVWDVDATSCPIAYGKNVGTINYCSGLKTKYMKMQDSLSFLGSFDTVWAIREDTTYAALHGINNAPFAFNDTILCRKGTFSGLLANDYDYETLQNALALKIETMSSGTFGNETITFPDSVHIGDTVAVVYRVGELIAEGDTLWGNEAKSLLVYHNSIPVLSLVSEKTLPKDESLTLSLSDVIVSDADGDDLSLIVGDGLNYTANGNTITPTKGFIGDIAVDVSVTDGLDTSNIMQMLVHVTELSFAGSIDAEPVLLFPNPCSDGFFINAGDKTNDLKIFNVDCRLVLSKEIQGTCYVDVRNLDAGAYVVMVNGLCYKLIKK